MEVPESDWPDGYRNWLAHRAGAPELGAAEFSLYSDALVVGHVVDGLGHYQLLNTISLNAGQAGHPSAAIILRAQDHLPETDEQPEEARGGRSWHGVFIDDELAALLSLALGIRCKSGGLTREFKTGSDPRGRPVEYLHSTPAQLRKLRRATEAYCVVLQTLARPPAIETVWS